MKEYQYLDHRVIFLTRISSAKIGDTGTVIALRGGKKVYLCEMDNPSLGNYFLPLYRRGELWDFA